LIRFRFPNGSSLQKKFYKEEKIIELYKFVHILTLDDKEINWAPGESTPLHKYEIMLSYPKIKLEFDKTLEEYNCNNNCTVFVREDID